MPEKKTIKLYSLPNDDLSSPPTLNRFQLILELIFFCCFVSAKVNRSFIISWVAARSHNAHFTKKGKEWTSLSYSCTKSNRELFMKTEIQWTSKRTSERAEDVNFHSPFNYLMNRLRLDWKEIFVTPTELLWFFFSSSASRAPRIGAKTLALVD